MLIDVVVMQKIEYRTRCNHNNSLLLRIADAEVKCLDQRVRLAGSDVIRPVKCSSAKVPEVLTVLMRVHRACFTKVCVPHMLWCDPYIRQVLLAAGVDEKLPEDVILQAARAFQDVCDKRDLWKSLIQGSGRSIHNTSDLDQLFRDMSLAVGQVALEFGSSKGIEALSKMRFLTNFAPQDFPFSFAAKELALTSPGQWAPPGLFTPHEEMAHDEFRHVCWTQCAIVAPELSRLPVPKPAFAVVVAHLSRIVVEAPKLNPKLLSTAIRETYAYLVKHTPEDVRLHATQLLGMPILLLPNLGDKPARFTAIKNVIHAPRIGSVEPYFFQMESFSNAPATHSLIRQVSTLSVPQPRDVIQMLLRSGSDYAASGRTLGALLTHVELLKLLVLCSDEHRIRLGFRGGTDSEEEDISMLHVPTLTYEMAPITRVCSPDAPHLVRRVRRGALLIAHQSVPLHVLHRLGVSSIVTVVQESPIEVVLCPELDEKERLTNMFFRSHAFARAIARILATEKRDEGSSLHLQQTKTSLLSADERHMLGAVQVKLVRNVVVSMVDIRNPTVNIGGTRESPTSCFDKVACKIFVCNAAGEIGCSLVDSFFLIALELNKLLNNKIRNLAPLACILKHAAEHPDRLEQTGKLLDVFGCSEVSSGACTAGNPVLDVDLAKRGTCNIDLRYPALLVLPQDRLVATRDEETMLFTWRHVSEVNASLLVAGASRTLVVVEFPAII